MTKTIVRKTVLASFALVIIASGVIAGQNLLTTPNTAQAITPPDSCFAFNAGTGTITDYYNNEGNNPSNPACPRDVEIPGTIGGVAVISIGNSGYPGAFTNKDINSVTIPEGVTSIGSYAFHGNNLTAINIPNNLINIGTNAFSYNNLTSITIPSKVTDIGTSAFSNNQLTSITIPNSVTSVGNRAFYYNKISSAIFLGDIVTFGTYIFENNPTISITYNGTTYTDKDPVSESCFVFSSGTITDYLYLDMNIIKDSGIGCLSRDIDIPSSVGGVPVNSIGDSAFYSNQLTSVSIPSGITNIGTYAFHGNRLATVNIPSSVSNIGDRAFNSNQLVDITIQGNPTTLGYGILHGNIIDTISYNGTLFTENQPISESCYEFSEGTIKGFYYAELGHVKSNLEACLNHNITIPNYIDSTAVTTIANGAFSYSNLDSVVIPTSITSIGARVFMGNQLTSVAIPDGVTDIGWFAFYANRLTSVDIPNSVTFIEDNAFFLQNKWGGHVAEYSIDGVPYVWSNDAAEVQKLFNNVWYAQLYTQNPSNPNNLRNVIISQNYEMGWDANDSGTVNDSLGGHLINPARVDTGYISSTGAQLSAPLSTTGLKTDGTPLRSYLVTETAIPAPLDPYNITPEEQVVMDAGFAQYYKLGNQVTLTAPATLAGLPLLRPASPHSLQLTQPVNTVNFIYGTPLRTIDFATPVGSATNPTANSVPSSVTPLLTKSTFSVSDTNACSQIQSASLVDGSDFTAPQTDQDVLGGLSFTIDCTASGGQADVSFALGGTITDLTGVKVYKQDSANTITDITNQVTLTNQSSPDGTRTTISYSVTDGEALDDDGLVNGTIVDPIYLTAPTGTAISLLGASSTGALADTGMSLPQIAGIAILTLALSSVLFIHLFLRPKLVAAKLKYRSLTRH